MLYGLIHARYILTLHGMETMVRACMRACVWGCVRVGAGRLWIALRSEARGHATYCCWPHLTRHRIVHTHNQ